MLPQPLREGKLTKLSCSNSDIVCRSFLEPLGITVNSLFELAFRTQQGDPLQGTPVPTSLEESACLVVDQEQARRGKNKGALAFR